MSRAVQRRCEGERLLPPGLEIERAHLVHHALPALRERLLVTCDGLGRFARCSPLSEARKKNATLSCSAVPSAGETDAWKARARNAPASPGHMHTMILPSP